MSDIFEAMEEDFEKKLNTSVERLDQSGLNTVAGLAKSIREQEDHVERLEQQLKDEKKKLLKLTDEELPTLLAEMNLSGIKLDDGSEVIVKQTYGANITNGTRGTVDNRPQAYAWLRENGHGDIIKNVLSCRFGMGDDDKAEEFRSMAEERKYLVEQNTTIPSSSLRAWVRERCEAGDEFPMELFGAYVGQRATIKRST